MLRIPPPFPLALANFVRTSAIALCAAPALAQSVDITSGVSGAFLADQPFNETRAADVTVMTPQGLCVQSMTLNGLNIGSATSAAVGARIYSSPPSGQLLASANAVVTSGGSVTIPILAELASGGSYRLAFHVATTPSSQGSGTLFDPTPPSTGGFPYTEPNGRLQINGGYGNATDSFPSDTRVSVPQITLQVASCVATAYCFGDGSSTSCPCSPAPVPHGAAGRGCPTNIFPQGSLAIAFGAASLGADTLVLTGTEVINSSMTFFQGTAQQSGGAGVVFGDGKRCVATTNIRRFRTKPVVGNTVSYPGSGDAPISTAGAIGGPGTRHYQGWYRSANPTFCTPDTFNLTNGLSVLWGS